ncbi:protein-methionine sulfoxide oxidase mical3b [Aplysia californica]|uniref:F-actin monooxygenase n=1 Tax=Aplysia californica TaxID=6500 RepID=A0ABM1A0Z0_APLCA|nr:protein-methionine sulfoxide oxidase mical3b [Aplysia californica]
MNSHNEDDLGASVEHVFDQFVTAVTCKSVLSSFHQLLDLTGLRHADHSHFYQSLKAKLKGSWKAQSLWTKLDKRASHRDYKRGQACKDIRVLVIGSGPCGLRTAIECALLGAKTVLVEKRDRFSRNNVLHLWPYLITDLRNLGAKKFFGKFCAGAIDHISIRQLQCILLKVALLLGVEVHVNVSFDGLLEPPEDQSTGIGWRCKVTPEDHAVSEYVFDVLVGADGKRNTLPGFKRKEFRGKLAIAITANFINRNTQAEARVEEISGVAFIFNQKFFLDLKESTRIDLENIVYYKDDTHYFVMTAKKASLLEKGVLKEDFSDTVALLDRSNVNQEALMGFAREAANFSTNQQLPTLDYAVNHYGQADVAMFDFTSMFAAENASRFILKNGHHLLMSLVGDSLLEPFWPTGSGCARGFLGAFDTAWMIRSWALGRSPPQVLAERESVYTVLSQTTPNYLHKNHSQYSIDPNTRYPNLNTKCVKPHQVAHLYEGGVVEKEEEEDTAVVPSKKPRNVEPSIDSYSLLRWCQRVLNTGKYRDVHVVDFTSSWRSGLALCALIHSFQPSIIDNSMLMEFDIVANNRLAFSVAERELGIPPVMSGEDMARHELPDKLTMISYLSQFYEVFKHQPLPSSIPPPVKAKRKSVARDQNPKSPRSPNRRISFLQKLSAKLAKSKKRKEQEEGEERTSLTSKKLKERQEVIQKGEVELMRYNKLPMEEIANRLQLDRKGSEPSKAKGGKASEDMMGAVSVTAMADLLVAKFKSYQDQPPPEPIRKVRGQPALLAASSASEFCSFCHKRVYIVERMSAEGEFFHRSCFRCDYCGVGLRLSNYACDRDVVPVKFYCYRHALQEQRPRLQRKRGFEEELKENIPETVVTPAPDVDTGQASKEKSPRKTAPSHLTPLQVPKDVTDRPKKTPERVEFEISFDGQEEESEEEQFEHNLRASLSSDTLLDDDDDDDSDSDYDGSDLDDFDALSESEIARILDEWSGAEDEVWENAVESLNTPGSPLTLEEACQLVGTWRRQHSQEDLLEAVDNEDRTPSRGQGYTRLLGDDAARDEGSSTEVEDDGADSDEETDDSSESEDSDEDKTEPALGVSPEDITEDSRTPSSPMARLSASKASFFSEPPTVVSLDPWSMFGIGKKAAGAAEERKKSVDTLSSGSRRSKKKSEDSRKEDMSSKDTDASESLELDLKSSESVLERDRGAGSLDELREDLESELLEEELTGDRNRRSKSVDSVESGKVGGRESSSQLKMVKVESEDLMDEEEEGGDDRDKGSDGDDERDEKGEEEEEDELMEKTAVSRAMEQLLLDIDHKSFSKDSSTEPAGADTSDSGDNEAYIEGRHSPSASKTRKFRMKRAARRSNGRRRSSSLMTTSESEAGRTEPTTTDNSRPQSSMSRSPSADIDDTRLKVKEASPPGSVDREGAKKEPSPLGRLQMNKQEDLEQQLSSVKEVSAGEESRRSATKEEDEDEAQTPQKSLGVTKVIDAAASASVGKGSGSLAPACLAEPEVSDLDTMPTNGDTDTLQQVLESIAAMPDLSDNSDIDELVLKNVDERFVTDRRSRRKKKKATPPTVKKGGKKVVKPGDSEFNSSFSISTPSGSELSVSSVEVDEFAGKILDVEPGDDDMKPDAEMLRDYQTTMSLVLGESYSDDQGDHEDQGEGVSAAVTEDNDLQVDKIDDLHFDKPSVEAAPVAESESSEVSRREGHSSITTDSSSFYATPDASVNESGSQQPPAPLASASSPVVTRRPLPLPRQKTDTPQQPKPVASSSPASPLVNSTWNKEPSPTPTPRSPLSLNTPSRNDQRESSGSEIFLSPVESFPESPLAKNVSAHATDKRAAAAPRSASKPTTTTTASDKKLLVSPRAKDSSPSGTKSPRKLPELPKLNVPSRQTPVPSGRTVDPPAMCSSPKPASRGVVAGPQSVSQQQTRVSRALPQPSNLSKLPLTKSGTPASSSIASTKPGLNSTFAKPITPPVFRPPGKTVVPLDKSKLRLGSSTECTDSDLEPEGKKKISTEGIVIGNVLEDIPFADESEAEEKFYTPHDPGKQERPVFPGMLHADAAAKKRLLPSPPAAEKAEPAVLSAEQIREIRNADREKAKLQARERARLKSDEELGLSTPTSPSHHTTPIKPRHLRSAAVREAERGHRSSSYDTPSTSDVVSDSGDDRISSVPSLTSSATEGEPPQKAAGKKGKKKVKTPKTPKTPKEKKAKDSKEKDSDDVEKKDKRKSLLALILPTKAPEKGHRATTDSDNTPKGSDDNSKSKKKSKIPKANKKKEKKGKDKVDARQDFDRTPTAEGRRDLAICSVFHSEASNRQSQPLAGGSAVRRTVPLAPKASGDELSDSDESHISISTMQRRREEDLDERVARRLRRLQLKQQRQAEQKRLRMAQEIQRQLEEVEVRQRELEERGITVEKALRGDGADEDVDESQLMSEWFTLVHEKNALLRYESELNVRAKELELEDRQARLELDFRERSRQPDKSGVGIRRPIKSKKSEVDIAAEGQLLEELLDVVEQRNTLVAMLEEDRLREQKEDNELKDMMLQKGFVLSPLSYDTRRERQKIEAPLASVAL